MDNNNFRNRNISQLVASAAFIFLFASCASTNRHFDLTDNQDRLDAYVKIRLSLDEHEEVVYHWSGTVYQFVTGEPTFPLFNIEGYSIGRAKKTNKGYYQLTREVMVFRDLETDTMLIQWLNPTTNEHVEVFQVMNDPVNFHLQKESFATKGSLINFKPLAYGQSCMFADIWLLYPSVLTVEDYPENTRSNLYQRGEMFRFFYEDKSLENTKLNSIPASLSWTSIGDYLPWMRMGDRPGHLVYVAQGSKLDGGFEAIPSTLKHYIRRSRPEFAEAPTFFTSPNGHSWKSFKEEMERRD